MNSMNEPRQYRMRVIPRYRVVQITSKVCSKLLELGQQHKLDMDDMNWIYDRMIDLMSIHVVDRPEGVWTIEDNGYPVVGYRCSNCNKIVYATPDDPPMCCSHCSSINEVKTK